MVIFRIGWGWIGSRYARFDEFLKKPSELINYAQQMLKGKAPTLLGHNPLAGWMAFSLIMVVFLITLTGVLILGGEEGAGYFYGFISKELGNNIKHVHEYLSMFLLLMIFVHVSGVLLDIFLHRVNIVWAMFTGYKKMDDEYYVTIKRTREHQRWRAGLITLIGILFISYQFWFPAPNASPDKIVLERKMLSPEQLQYRKECGDCHFDFHPSLLPSGSWKAVMEGLDEHFGEDASLKEKKRLSIENYLVTNSAERNLQSEASFKILTSIPSGDKPLRITKAPYWIRKHEKITSEVFKQKSIRSPLNCVACHAFAGIGSFEDADILIPKE